MSRAGIALLKGDLVLALQNNILILLLFPLLFHLGKEVLHYVKGEKVSLFQIKPKWAYGILIVILVYGVIRNIPIFPFLRPVF